MRHLIFRGACVIAGSLFFCSASPAAEAPAPLTFVAWNLRNYLHTAGPPPPQAKGATRPKPPDEIAAVTRILVSLRPDILGLCEVGSPADLAALQQRLRAEGLDLPHSEHLQGPDQERRLALLSRFPIASRQSVPRLTYLIDEAMMPVQRGFLDVTIQVNETYQLRCVGVHLKSRRDVPEANEALMRRNEAHLLRLHADAILSDDPDTNLLVYGDCNDTRDTAAIRAIAGVRGSETSLTPIAAADAAGQRWTYYYPASDTYSRVDYLFASRSLNPELDDKASTIYSGADWSRASDHRPVTTLIRPADKKTRPAKPARSEKK